MATNLALDDALIVKAMRIGKHRTKKEAVTAALSDYVRANKRAGFDALVGTVEYYDDAPGIVKANKKQRRRPA